MDRHQQELAMDTVRDLVETCRDSEAGFLRAARRSQKTGLKEFMGAEALQQALFVAELELELKKLGVSAKPLTPRPAKVRGWKEIRGTCLLPSGDETVLLLCERGREPRWASTLLRCRAIYLLEYLSFWSGSISN